MDALDRIGPPAPPPAVMRILDRFNRDQIGSAIEVMVALLDVWDGDPDAEDDDPAEAAGDEKDAAWIEWDQMRGPQKRGPNIAQENEDEEEDDPAGQYDEDYWTGPAAKAEGAGCPISDPGENEDGI